MKHSDMHGTLNSIYLTIIFTQKREKVEVL